MIYEKKKKKKKKVIMYCYCEIFETSMIVLELSP